MSVNDFKNLFVNELGRIFDAKKQILSAIPRLIESVESSDLKSELRTHFGETQKQIDRLMQIFLMLGAEGAGKNCQTMRDLLQEAEQAINLYSVSSVRDAALISIAQRIAHYEMAVYGALRTFAKDLGYKDAMDLLQMSLNEEGNANKKLMKIAEGGFFTSGVNQYAMR